MILIRFFFRIIAIIGYVPLFILYLLIWLVTGNWDKAANICDSISGFVEQRMEKKKEHGKIPPSIPDKYRHKLYYPQD